MVITTVEVLIVVACGISIVIRTKMTKEAGCALK